jgi:hypothetical protein
MSKLNVFCAGRLGSALAALLLVSAMVAGPAAAFAETEDDTPVLAQLAEPAGSPVASENPYYGPGWTGPLNHAPAALCPVWYSAHDSCTPSAAP